MKPLQQSKFKVTPFFLIIDFSLYVPCENSNNVVSLWAVNTYLGNKYNNTCFFYLHWEEWPQSLHRPRKRGLYLNKYIYIYIYICICMYIYNNQDSQVEGELIKMKKIWTIFIWRFDISFSKKNFYTCFHNSQIH